MKQGLTVWMAFLCSVATQWIQICPFPQWSSAFLSRMGRCAPVTPGVPPANCRPVYCPRGAPRARLAAAAVTIVHLCLQVCKQGRSLPCSKRSVESALPRSWLYLRCAASGWETPLSKSPALWSGDQQTGGPSTAEPFLLPVTEPRQPGRPVRWEGCGASASAGCTPVAVFPAQRAACSPAQPRSSSGKKPAPRLPSHHTARRRNEATRPRPRAPRSAEDGTEGSLIRAKRNLKRMSTFSQYRFPMNFLKIPSMEEFRIFFH